MWKAALITLIAFVAFVGSTLEWGSTLDGRRDPCIVRGEDVCADDPETTTTPSTTALATTTTGPATSSTAPTGQP